MYNSFAIWIDRESDTTTKLGDVSADLHFNLWLFSSQKNNFFDLLYKCILRALNKGIKSDCLDIGIKIKKHSEISFINLFVPYIIIQKNVQDLGEVITKTEDELVKAIFNECSSVGLPELNVVKVTIDQEKDDNLEKNFNIYHIDVHNDIKFKNEHEKNKKNIVGTTIKINTNNITTNNSDAIYLRFRIDFPSKSVLKKIIHNQVPKDHLIQSSTEKKQFIEFKLNETRNLPTEIKKRCLNQFLKIEKIHFFLMREFADDLSMSDPVNSGYRVLEKDTWSRYICGKPKLLLNNIIAYHWKVSPEEDEDRINSFTLSTKFSFQESFKIKTLFFMAFTLLIGACGGVGGNYLTKKYFDNDKKSPIQEKQFEQKPINPSLKTDNLEKKLRTEDN